MSSALYHGLTRLGLICWSFLLCGPDFAEDSLRAQRKALRLAPRAAADHQLSKPRRQARPLMEVPQASHVRHHSRNHLPSSLSQASSTFKKIEREIVRHCVITGKVVPGVHCHSKNIRLNCAYIIVRLTKNCSKRILTNTSASSSTFSRSSSLPPLRPRLCFILLSSRERYFRGRRLFFLFFFFCNRY